MPTNSRWRWQICTKTAKTVLLAGASIMLIMLNSLCWQQRLVRLWKERSKPFLRSLWMVFQMARLTNKGRFAVLAHSREVCCCLSHVSTLRGCWRQLASGMGRRKLKSTVLPALVVSFPTHRAESSFQLWQPESADEKSRLKSFRSWLLQWNFFLLSRQIS